MKALVLTTTTDFTLRLLMSLTNCGFQCHVLGTGRLRGVSLSKYCEKYFSCDPSDLFYPSKKFADIINTYSERENIDVVIAADYDSLYSLSTIRPFLLPSIPIFPTAAPAVLHTLNNKWELSQLLRTHGIPQPLTLLLNTADDIASLRIGFPVIVKPLEMGDTVGVVKIKSREELLQHISQKDKYCRPPLLIQEFIPGKDVDLNILADCGKVISWSIQEWISGDTLHFISHDGVLDAGNKIVSASGFSGIAHFDMRIDSRDNSVKVIECNPRFWGSLRASLWNGTNFIEQGIFVAQKKPLSEQAQYQNTTYVLPSKILKRFLQGKISFLKDLPRGSKKDLWMTLSDPVSFFYITLMKILGRHYSLNPCFGYRDRMKEKVRMGNIIIDNLTWDEAIQKILNLISQKKTAYVVTPNADHMVNLQKDAEFKKIYDQASLVLADGMPLMWAADFLGTPLKKKLSGSDLFPKLCEVAAKSHLRVFFLGGRPGAADESAKILKSALPSLQIAGVYCPPFGFEKDTEENDKILQMIAASNPDILFVGLGAPKQEKWIYRFRDRHGVPLSIGVGASFDFCSGLIKRAPEWMQSSGLEWLSRLLQEPKRLWKRYLVEDIKFFWLVLKQRFSKLD